MKSIIDIYNEGQKNYKMIKRWERVEWGMLFRMKFLTISKKKYPWSWKGLMFFNVFAYEFINNSKYKFIEIMQNDYYTKVDFWQWMQVKKYSDRDEYEHVESITAYCFSMGGDMLVKPTKQMLKGYWEEYIINRLREEGR